MTTRLRGNCPSKLSVIIILGVLGCGTGGRTDTMGVDDASSQDDPIPKVDASKRLDTVGNAVDGGNGNDTSIGVASDVLSGDARSDVVTPGDGTSDTGPSDAMSDPVPTHDGSASDPCPAIGSPCRIMPLGDSITWGDGSTDKAGYRVPLFRKALVNKKTMTFVGSENAGPTAVDGTPFPRGHEGFGGYTVDPGDGKSGISPLVPGALAKHKPHIVLLMIGTNDVASRVDLPNLPKRLSALLDTILANSPGALLAGC